MEISGYDSFEKIGAGGMASVWKARQISLDRPVAIKILTSSYSADDEEIDQFQSEARIAASINHTGIVQVYDAFYRNNLFCFVMEYIDGFTIAQWIKSKGYLTERECLFVAKGVAEALKYAWGVKKIVHCDIKPDNIMLDSDGSVKVTDLGLSRGIGTIQTRKKIREQNDSENIVVFGTPAYISPEQACGDENILPQADMYSLGATLFHMATGRRLFMDNNIDDIMDMQVNNQEKDPMEYNSVLTAPFCDFLEKLLAKEPEGRYESWDEVIEDINNINNGFGLSAGPLNLELYKSTIALSQEHLKKRNAIKYTKAAIINSVTSTIKRLRKRIEKSKTELLQTRKINLSSIKKRFSTFEWNLSDSTTQLCIRLSTIFGVVAIALTVVFYINKANNQKELEYIESLKERIVQIEENYESYHNYAQTLDSYDSIINDHKTPHDILVEACEKKDVVLKDIQKKKKAIIAHLKSEARIFEQTKDYTAVINVYINYNGELKDETFAERESLARPFYSKIKKK